MKLKLLFIFTFVYALGFSQQTDYVDFKKATCQIAFEPELKTVLGVVHYEFQVLQNVDSIYLDAVNMSFKHMFLDGLDLKYINDGKKLWLKNSFKKGESYKVSFNYKVSPKKALYFIEKDNEFQIWTQGQGKYTSNWLPSIDDMNDKIEFDLSITFENDYEVIANGKLIDKHTNKYTTTWHYNMEKPMCSYLVALAIGKYDKKVEYSESGIPLEMYYYPEDSLKFEPTYRYTKQMFDFLEEEIGVPYSWQNYKQVPVKDFLYAGMENTGTTLFSDSFVIDFIAFVDKNYVNVNAHELAHQWFGNLVTETSGTHHWLHEGFATYYALLAEKEVFGEDYYYWRLYEYAQELLEQDKAGESTSLLNPKSSSATFYKKGCWVLHILREKVGDKAFKDAVKNYLEKHQFKNVETDDFIGEVEKRSEQDLSEFVKVWLEDDKFYYLKCYEELKKSSELISTLNSFNEELKFSSHPLEFGINRYWDNVLNSSFKDYLVNANEMKQLHDSIYVKVFKSKNIKVRQAIAQNLTDIPSELKEDYESFLNDKSYLTTEVALFNLWRNFPEDRSKYLDKTKGIIGFNDKNVRLLWLTLALITEEYQVEFKKRYFDELTSYTSPKYGFEIRQNAFQYLSQIKACGETCKENLEQATKHHNWRFKKFAKQLKEQFN